MEQPTPPGASEVVGVCIVRVWVEPGASGLRARVSAVPDIAGAEETVATVTGRGAVLAAVDRFLDAVEVQRGRDGPVTDAP
jgi:hypothetical protein